MPKNKPVAPNNNPPSAITLNSVFDELRDTAPIMLCTKSALSGPKVLANFLHEVLLRDAHHQRSFRRSRS